MAGEEGKMSAGMKPGLDAVASLCGGDEPNSGH
jgi:hypothetical protein